MAEKTNNMEGFEGVGELSEVERIALKMRQDIKRALLMSGATEEQAEKILKNAKITVTGDDGVERPLEN
uniref:Uncharacterized protein n=1 Tax=Thermodesulfovibrio aggregans TaxID=86166 RepID=A0A7C4ELP2_9BACT